MKDQTKLVAILDASGSMSRLLDNYIEGYNSFVEAQRNEAPNDPLTLIFFDSVGWGRDLQVRIKTKYADKPLREVAALTRDDYRPMGGTPLYDAIGQTIDKVGMDLAAIPAHERPARVMIIIQTDGEENSSQEYTKEMIAERISHQRDIYSWEFLFLSADENAIKDAQSFGIQANMTVAYESTSLGTAKAFSAASAVTTRYRSGG